jgi:hypothetical protein
MVDEPQTTEACLTKFTEHWAKAQIDGPMQTIARYDDLAKLLITIGSFVLGILAAMLRGPTPMNLSAPRAGLVLGSMLLFFLSAAAVCYPQPKMRARDIIDPTRDESLPEMIDAWCANIDSIVHCKRRLLYLATFLFVSSFIVIMWLLLRPI